jgi:serine/threonine protein kinase
MLTLLDYDIRETLSEDAKKRVYRGTRRSTGAKVILKTQAAAAARGADLRHEFELLREFNFPGVAKAWELVEHEDDLILVEEDIGGVPLSECIAAGPCPVGEFLFSRR